MDCLLVAVGYASFGQVVWRHFQSDAMAGQNTNAVAAQLAGQMGEYCAFLIKLNAEQPAGEFFNYGTCDFNTIFFAHCPPMQDYNKDQQSERCGTPADRPPPAL